MTAPPSAPAATHEPQLRAAGQATRAAIERAARGLFAEHGFTDTSVRAIAAEAGVDPALVVRHFGSKEALFLATLDISSSALTTLLQGPLEGLGRALVEHALSQTGTRTRQTMVALLQASHRPQVREEMDRLGHLIFVDPLVARLDGPDRALRVAMVWAQYNGLMNALVITDDAVLRSDRDAVVAAYGASLQRLLTPDAQV